jgi:hypothetical protein
MSKHEQPDLLTVNKQHRIVIASARHPKRTVVIGESKKGLFVLFQCGTEVTVDKRGNLTTRIPNVSEVF